MSFIAEYWNTILVILMRMPMVRAFKPCTFEGQNSHGHTLRFHPQTQKLKPPCTANKQYHRKVLICSFHLNGHTLGFLQQTQKLEPA